MANTLKFGNGQWATKEGSTLAYNDENGNFKPLPFTFDRASSATRVNKDGLIETVGADQPRVDYLNDSKGALKLEPSRTNLVAYSEDLSNSNWVKISSTEIISNNTISPDGTLNADKVNASTNYNSLLGFQDGFSVSSGFDYSISFFAKKGNLRYLQLFHGGGQVVGNARTNFDLENGVVTVSDSGHDASIKDYGNGWFRCIVSLEAVLTTLQLYFNAVKDPNASRSAASSWSANDNLFIWGIQLEQASYATSYIPTQGSAVTRVADNAYQQGVTQVIGQSEGTMFIEFIPKDSSTLQILYQAKSSSGVVGQIDIRLQSGLIRALANDGGGSQFFINGGSYAVGTKYKVAIRYKLNDSKLYINGTDSGSDTSCSFTGSSLDQVSFADSLSSFLPSVDIIDSRLYNTALSDSELQALTT